MSLKRQAIFKIGFCIDNTLLRGKKLFAKANYKEATSQLMWTPPCQQSKS
jgi:hypothetical protein